jgi:hypothetical protein
LDFLKKTVNKSSFSRLTASESAETREHLKRQKEKAVNDAKLRSFVFEAIYYVIFVAVILLAAFQNIDRRSFHLKTMQADMLGLEGLNSTLATVKTPADVWNWISLAFVPSLKLQKWFVLNFNYS